VTTICFGQATWDKFSIDSRLTEANETNLKRYADSVQATVRNYSLSKIARKYDGLDSIRLCTCKMYADTLKIRGLEFSEGGVTYQVKVKGKKFSTETIFYSDIQEYGINNDQFELVISSLNQSLTLNKKKIKTGDKIRGKLNIQSRPVGHLRTKPTIEFIGTFQCIVE